jgi:hypothetical protein
LGAGYEFYLRGKRENKAPPTERKRFASVIDHSEIAIIDHSEIAFIDHAEIAIIDRSEIAIIDHSEIAIIDHSEIAMGRDWCGGADQALVPPSTVIFAPVM